MSAFKRTPAPSRPTAAEQSDSDDSETATTMTSDDDDDDDDADDDEDSGKRPAFVRAAATPQRPAAGSGSDEDETEGEEDEDEEHDTLSDEDEGETDEELSEGEPRAEPTSAANARAVARPQTPGEVSAELVELALEVVDGEDVSPVVRLAFERAAPQVCARVAFVLFAASSLCVIGLRRRSSTRLRPSSAGKSVRRKKSWHSTMKSS